MHNIAKGKNGKDAFYGAIQPAWHGLGTVLDHVATAAEAIEAAGLDYEVVKAPLKLAWKGGEYAIDNRKATFRTDTNECLGVVGNDYGVLQNKAAFGFFDPLVEKDAAIYHTAGALGKGEKAWILAKLPDHIRIGKTDDIIEKFVLLYHGHDGKTGIKICLTSTRVVCQNTLHQALITANNIVTLSHTKNVEQKMQEAFKLLDLVNKKSDEMGAIYNAMAKLKMNDEQIDTYFNDVWKKVPGSRKQDDLEEGEMIMQEKTYDELHNYLITGPGQDMSTTKGTLFGAYNAITGWTDHVKEYEGDKLKSLWFNGGKSIKDAAYKTAISLLN